MNPPSKTLNVINPEHLRRMRFAVKAAENARGTCSPNPFVGAVIVKNNTLIAEGWTQTYGGDHAEVQALKKAGAHARDADLYVTLEPCSHHGKTPPCTKAIIAAGIKRVFIGILDPNPLVSGNAQPGSDSPGIRSLRKAGIEIQTGIMADVISRQLESYLCRINKKRPFVVWKAALSLDGKYAARDGSARWITGEKARLYVHALRSQMDVVLTGIGTVLADDPQLNVRLPRPRRQPVRAILDPKLDLPLDSQLASSLSGQTTYIFHDCDLSRKRKRAKLEKWGAQLFPIPCESDHLDLNQVLAILHDLGHNSVLLECGSQLSSSFFAAGLVDKCLIFYGSKLLGGPRAMLSELDLPSIEDAIQFQDISLRKLGNDLLLSAYPLL